MLTFIVPPFFWPDDDAAEGLLDAVPAKAAATNIAAPIAPIAPESHTRLRIGLLSEGVSISAFRRNVEFFVSPASISYSLSFHRVLESDTAQYGSRTRLGIDSGNRWRNDYDSLWVLGPVDATT